MITIMKTTGQSKWISQDKWLLLQQQGLLIQLV